MTPEPGNLATASEPGIQAASTGDTEEKVKAPKSPVDKSKNEEVSVGRWLVKMMKLNSWAKPKWSSTLAQQPLSVREPHS